MISGNRPPRWQEECWMNTAKEKRPAPVTGGSRGLGRAMALELAGAGAHVAVNYFNRRDAAEQTCATIRQSGGYARGLLGDVRDESGGARPVGGGQKSVGAGGSLARDASRLPPLFSLWWPTRDVLLP